VKTKVRTTSTLKTTKTGGNGTERVAGHSLELTTTETQTLTLLLKSTLPDLTDELHKLIWRRSLKGLAESSQSQ